MLTHRVDGDGPPLVLLNGGLMTIASWDPFLPALARFRVIRCDFRGQLLSAPPFPLTLGEHAADVFELLDHLGIDRASFAGASFGGLVAIEAAAMQPERVKKLLVITAAARGSERLRRDAESGRRVAEGAANGSGEGGELLRGITLQGFSREWLERQAPEVFEQRLRQFAALPPDYFRGASAILAPLETLDLTDTLPKITAPTLVIAAEDDAVFPLGQARETASLIPNAKLEIIKDAPHAALVERAVEVIGKVAEFLA